MALTSIFNQKALDSGRLNLAAGIVSIGTGILFAGAVTAPLALPAAACFAAAGILNVVAGGIRMGSQAAKSQPSP